MPLGSERLSGIDPGLPKYAAAGGGARSKISAIVSNNRDFVSGTDIEPFGSLRQALLAESLRR